MSFTVSLSRVPTVTVRVNYATKNGSAVAGTDYVATSGTLTFAPGVQSKTVTVTVKGDRQVEPNEKLAVRLSNATGTPLGNNSGTGTIQNDD